MYALEERIKAVKLYFRHGRKTSAVIRELGYPDCKMLARWAKEYEETGKLSEGCTGNNRYRQEEKQEAVDFYLGHWKQISYTIRSLGYPSREKLMEWIDELASVERIIHEYLSRLKPVTLPAHSFRFHLTMDTIGVQLATSTTTPAAASHILDT